MFLILGLFVLLDAVDGECNQKYTIKNRQAIEVVSQSYPYNFTRNVHCFYDFLAEFNSGNVIHVKVQEVSLSCDDPKTSLEVYDAFNTSPKFLGRICQGNPMLFVSPRERLYLVFKSSGSGSSGFKLRVESVPEFSHCYKEKTKVVNAIRHPQYLVTPYYPYEVAPNVHCRWLIKSPPGHKVILNVQDASLKGSNDCSNFGLYIYDGKTNYDDERIGKLCDNVIGTRTFTSTSVYLMVVFTSGPNVLHSGGGVKLSFRSSYVDEDSDKDRSLLFILIGVLFGVAFYTILMIIIRYVIVPARRRNRLRQCGQTRSASLMPLRSFSVTSSMSEPPPPYRATDSHVKTGILETISQHLVSIFKPSQSSSSQNIEGAINSGFDPQLVGPDADDLNNYVYDGDASRAIKMTTPVNNDYRELPLVPGGAHIDAGDPGSLYDTLSSVGQYSDNGGYEECYPVEHQSSEDYNQRERMYQRELTYDESEVTRAHAYSVIEAVTGGDKLTDHVMYVDVGDNNAEVAMSRAARDKPRNAQSDYESGQTDEVGSYHCRSTGPVGSQGRRIDEEGYDLPIIPDEHFHTNGKDEEQVYQTV